MSRSRRMTYSSPCTSTSNRSSGLNNTLSPTLMVRTWGPTATTSAHANRRDTWAVAGIKIPDRDRRSPSACPTCTNTRSASTEMGCFGPSPAPSRRMSGVARVTVATTPGYQRRPGCPSRPPRQPSRRADSHAGRGQVVLGFPHRELAEMEDRRGQDGIGRTFDRSGHQVIELPHPSRGNQGNRTTIGNSAGEGEVESIPGAVTVHRGEQDLTGADGCAPFRPMDRVDAGGSAPSMGEHLPGHTFAIAIRGWAAAGIDGHHHALGTELRGDLGDQLRSLHRRGVDAHLVGTGPQQPAGIFDRPDATAHREGDEYLLGGAGDNVDHGLAVIRGCGDVEEDQLVGPLGVVAGSQLDRVAGVEQLDELDAFDDAPGVHVETGDDSHRAPAATPSSTVMRPSTRALPQIAPVRRRFEPPARTDMVASSRMSSTEPTPPDAITGSAVASRTAARPTRSGPCNIPSRSMAVTITADRSTWASSSSRSARMRPLCSSQPRMATSARPSPSIR